MPRPPPPAARHREEGGSARPSCGRVGQLVSLVANDTAGAETGRDGIRVCSGRRILLALGVMNATSAGTRRETPCATSAKAPPRATGERKIILVGTYRKRQLERWILPRGLYNYPVKEEDTVILEDSPLVSEIWLYLGKAGKRRFAATFDRAVSAVELDGLGYPKGLGPHHADRYLLFRVKPLSEEAAPPDAAGAPAPRIDIRIDDFAQDKALQSALKERFSGTFPKPPTAEDKKACLGWLPEDLLEDWLGNLFVCEAAEQLTLWEFRDEGGPALKPRMTNAPGSFAHSAFAQPKVGTTE